MIILYKKCDKRKIPGILSFMKKENLTASHLTYRILIATRGETRDLIGMEQLLEDMKSHGLQPDAHFVTDLISNVNDIVKDGDMHHLLNRKIFLLCYIHLHRSML